MKAVQAAGPPTGAAAERRAVRQINLPATWGTILLMCLGVGADNPLSVLPSLEYSQTVGIDRIYGDGSLRLKSGERYFVFWDEVSHEELVQWESADSLLLRYNLSDGCFLENPATMSRALVFDGFTQHPIDLLAEDCPGLSGGTYDMQGCLVAERQLWAMEIDRINAWIAKSCSADTVERLKAAQESWEVWTREFQEAIITGYADAPGTIYRLVDPLGPILRWYALELQKQVGWLISAATE